MVPALNLWEATAGAPVVAPPLEGEVRAGAVIVGGGFTGLSAALHLAEAGVDTCLLEARSIGYGGSGRNVGLVNAGLWTPPDEVEALLGKEEGARLNAALASAPSLVFSLVEKHGIACEAVRAGTLHLAHSPAGLRDLERRHAQQVKRGAPVELLDARQTAARTGSESFEGALLDNRAGTIQPLAYARGLARAAQAAGARLHQESPALAVRHENGEWVVETPLGPVVARHLIRATNGYSVLLAPPPFTPVSYLQAATPPLAPDQLEKILPGRQGCWDTATVMSSIRLDAAGRLVVGGVGSLEWAGRGLHLGWARRKMKKLYPFLGELSFQFAWSGRIAMTGDHLPRVARIGPNAVSIFGYSGRGIGPGTLFGKAAAEWVLTGAEDRFPLKLSQPKGEAFSRLKEAYYEAGSLATHMVGGWK
ncbi:FAD-binding oxidoreductase [Afifella sp. IM 167]|uniref:NAD(P)/FAD-dependent oxidoreductase n=1 Tax=Afifella sp. IM 167 TaxID=2033586 RepID=UPI001CCAF961|nr:FAD-binding oxidoreductase [Afifella sp. IM 167]MBZ8133865.1 FAD-dependent oxidoreductase [Afifella sp. IM 167]